MKPLECTPVRRLFYCRTSRQREERTGRSGRVCGYHAELGSSGLTFCGLFWGVLLADTYHIFFSPAGAWGISNT